MGYRVKTGRPVQHKGPGQLNAVQFALRERGNGYALAMSFDPGEAANEILIEHAADIMLGLMLVRGWRDLTEEILIGPTNDWTDRWWERPLGPNAFVIEANLAPAAATDPKDIERMISLTTIAWCMEREMHLDERPTPDLMTAFAPDGIVLANIHPEPVRDAMRAQRQSIIERMATLLEPMRSATYAHVLIHLDGNAVRPWSLPSEVCTFGTGSADPAADRVFVALEDTSEAPRPETARALLRLMLGRPAREDRP